MGRRVLRAVVLALAGLLWALPHWRAPAPVVLWNLSASLPEGLYLRDQGRPEVGATVAACLPAPAARLARARGYVGRGGRCAAGTRPVLKQIAALEGARVERGEEVLRIEGRPWPRTAPRAVDRLGRPMRWQVAYPYRVPPGQLLLLNRHPDSFDGRYFGPVPREAILGVYRLLWSPEAGEWRWWDGGGKAAFGWGTGPSGRACGPARPSRTSPRIRGR